MQQRPQKNPTVPTPPEVAEAVEAVAVEVDVVVTNVEEFQERWGSVSDVRDGKCTPRPRRLEMKMEPD